MDGSDDWDQVWKNYLPPRIKLFLWLVKRQRLLTNSEQLRRCLTDDSSYHVCGGIEKTILHMLCDCSFAKKVWMNLLSSNNMRMFFNTRFEAWLHAELAGQFPLGINGTDVAILSTVHVGCYGRTETGLYSIICRVELMRLS